MHGVANVHNFNGMGGNDTLIGERGADSLEGGDGDDLLQGGLGNDHVHGGAGNDTIDGEAGDDHAMGGAGDDLFRVDTTGDVIAELANEGNDTVIASPGWTLGDNFENLTLVGSSDGDATGNALANVLRGNAGNNSLWGRLGDDTIFGGAGDNDVALFDIDLSKVAIARGAGGIWVASTEGIDFVAEDVEYLSFAGDFQITYEQVAALLTDRTAGTALTDLLRGTPLGDHLLGREGADGIEGRTGDDTIEGGSGNDTIFGEAGDDSLLGGLGDDSLEGGAGDDLVQGDVGNDQVHGGDGDDTLDGGLGADHAMGGAGDDVYIVDQAGDQVIEAAGAGNDTLCATVNISLSANVETLVLMGTGNLDGTGNAAANHLVGNAFDNVLAGAGGADTVDGGSGLDTAVIGAARALATVVQNGDRINITVAGVTSTYQQIESFRFTDTTLSASEVFLPVGVPAPATPGPDRIVGTIFGDRIDALAGHDSVEGVRGNDTIFGNLGNDSLFGGEGNDILFGQGVDDMLYGGPGNDILDGGGGSDLIWGGADNDLLSYAGATVGAGVKVNLKTGIATGTADGVSFTHTIKEIEGVDGSRFNDTVTGGAGHDRLQGNAGNDFLYGDGLGVASILGTANQVFRLYRATLGRDPDGGGHLDWSGRILEGQRSLSEVAAGFVGSREFQNTYGALSNNAFVELLYQNVLGRSADAAGLATWVGQLNAGTQRADVVLGFSESVEFKRSTTADANTFAGAHTPATWSDEVYRLYHATLGRDPDLGGLISWTDQLGNATRSLSQVSAGFVGSREFQNTYGALSNTAFVELLYQNVLNRAADAGGLATWVGQLNAGTQRADVVLGFSQSREFVNATTAGLKAWMRVQGDDDVLDGGAGTNVLSGGRFADTFVFDATEDGTHRVLDLEVWDKLRFDAFGYAQAGEARSHMAQSGVDVVFADQGVNVILANFQLSQITDDMIFL